MKPNIFGVIGPGFRNQVPFDSQWENFKLFSLIY